MFKRSVGIFISILLFFGSFVFFTDFYSSVISQVELLLVLVLLVLSGIAIYFAFAGSETATTGLFESI